MSSWFSSLIQWFSSLFFSKSAEIAVVGLQVIIMLTPNRSTLGSIWSCRALGRHRLSTFWRLEVHGLKMLFPLWPLVYEQVCKTGGVPKCIDYVPVKRDNIKLKIWDVAGIFCWFILTLLDSHPHSGQPRYRNLWERYCKGSDAVVYVFQHICSLLLIYYIYRFVVDSQDVCHWAVGVPTVDLSKHRKSI